MRNKIKKYISIITITLLIFSNFGGLKVKAASPEVNQSVTIEVDKSLASSKDNVKVSVTAANMSKIANIEVDYQSPNHWVALTASYNPATGKFEANIPVRYSSQGTWKVTAIDIYYKDGSYDEVGSWEADLSNGDFTVSNEDPSLKDSTDPIFTSVSVDKTTAAPGDVVKVSVDASDDLSGISFVKLTYEGTGQKTVLATYNDQTHKFEAEIPNKDFEKPGDWSLTELTIKDYAGNNYDNYYGSDLASGNFTVQNDNLDETPPVLNGITIDQQDGKPGEQLTVSLDVTDDQSGVKYVSLDYYNEDFGSMNVNAELNEKTGKYEAKIPIDYQTRPGKWNLSMVFVTDNSDNTQRYDYDQNQYFDNASFTVTNPGYDDNAGPVVHSVTVDKQNVNYGENETISFDVTDEGSGVKKVSVNLENDDYSKTWQISKDAVYNSETQKYEIKLPITYDLGKGKWKITNINVEDNRGNTNYYNDSGDLDFSTGEFTVLEDNMDTAPPVVQGVTVDKKEVNLGEEVKVSLDVTDDKSGVESVGLQYDTANGGFEYTAYYNKQTGKYEADFLVTDSTIPGDWNLYGVYVQDKANNGMWVTKTDGVDYHFDFSQGNFNVTNPNADITPPTLNGISVDKQTAQPGDTVLVNIDATDDKSGLDYIEAEYHGSNGGDLWGDAVYNSDTQKYEVPLTIDDQTKPGTWSISSLQLVDKQGNRKSYYSWDGTDLSSGNFTVNNDKIDIAAPEIKGVSIDKKEAKPGDTVTMSIDASDDKSGINSLSVYLQTGDREVEKEAVYNQETEKYEIKIPIDDSARPGTWSINYIYVNDNSYNSNWIYPSDLPDIADSSFTVTNDNADVTPPTVKAVSVDKQEAEPGDTVTVSIDAADDKSDISQVEVEYTGSHGGYKYVDATYNPDTQKYEANLPIDEETDPGTWSIDYIYLRDSQDNGTTFNNQDTLKQGDFTVKNPNIDVDAPIIKSVSVDKTEAKNGDTVTVSIDAVDAQSGIRYIGVQYQAGNRYLDEQEAVYNSETGKYELKLPIGDSAKNGVWSISSIYLSDKDYNDVRLYNGENQDFSSGDFTVTNENADITPPTFKGVTVDKDNTQPGDTVTVSVDADDDKSGINNIYLYYRGSNGGSFYQPATYNPTTQKYEAQFSIDDQTRPGTWSISSIYLEDKEWNETWVYKNDGTDLSSGTFTVTNPNIDVAAPIVKSVSVDKQEAHNGDIVTLSIDASDESGINNIGVQYYDGNRYLDEKEAVYNSETGKYELKLPIDDSARNGTWSIDSIYLSDTNYNGVRLYNGEDQDFSGGNFTVINENADVTPPTVKGISVDKTEAQPGDTVTVSIDANDDKSGVQYVSVSYRNSYGDYINKYGVLNENTGKFEVEVPINDQTKPGTWSIASIELDDNAGNSVYLDTFDGVDFSGGNFTVKNDNADITPPSINNVSVDKTEAKPGDSVKVSLDITDDKSDVNSVNVSFNGPQGGYMWQEAVYNTETKKYEVTLPINDHTKPGTWSISSVNVSDSEGNYKSYDNGVDFDFSDSNFTVINENADITPPTIQSVSVDKSEARPGDNIKVSIDAKDEQSQVDQVSVNYRNSVGNTMWSDAVYNETTGKYEATLNITDSTRSGAWSMDGISVSDTEGNYNYYQNGFDGNDFSNADFTVINENADLTPPTLKGVSVDKTDAHPGDEVTVSVDAEDKQSGIGYIQVDYMLPNNEHYNKTEQAYFNADTGKYEAKFTIEDFAPAGTWKLRGIFVEDNERNSLYIDNNKAYAYANSDSMDLSNADFAVVNENGDSTPPDVKSVKVNQNQFVPGETAVIELDVTDSQSGVDSVYVGLSGKNGGYRHAQAVYNESTHKYEVQIPVDNETKPGLWSLDYISVSDKEGNSDDLSGQMYDFSGANYTVENDAFDVTPPSVQSISIDKKEVKPGDELNVSLDVTDDKSDISSVSVAFKNSKKDFWGQSDDIWETAVYNEQTHKYEAKLPITENTKPGTWSVDYVSVSDSEGNYKDLYNGQDADFSNGDFTVVNDQADISAPEYHGVTVDKKEVNVGENITYSVDATDSQSGIRDVYLVLDGSMDVYTASYNPETKKYDVSVPITKDYKPGTWKVQSIEIYDNQNNSLVEDSNTVDFSSLDFDIVNPEYAGNNDNLVDYISSISVDKSTVKPGEDVKLSINFKDNSKIKAVNIGFEGPNGVWYDPPAYYNEKTGAYEVKVHISSLFKPGVWSLEGIYVEEKDDQFLNLFTNDKVDFHNGDFSVNNQSLDSVPPTAPVVEDVTDQSITVTGTTEANAQVIVKLGDQVLGTTYADREGHFAAPITAQSAGTELTVVAVDSSENISEGTLVTVKDGIAPAAPKVNDLGDNATVVTGTTEAGATVTVTVGTDTYKAQADSTGAFTVNIPVQKAGVTVAVTATDAAGNTSDAASVIVKDMTAPVAPTVDEVADNATVVTGVTETGATVTVTIGTTNYTATADSTGAFTVTIPVQTAGAKVSVTATDEEGNTSTAKTVTVVDKTAPVAPSVDVVGDNATVVTGKAEAGATVTVTIGTTKYTAQADNTGAFTVTIPVQKAGVKVSVNATDAAGNTGEAASVTVKDVTAPTVPTVNTLADNVKVVTGTTEAGATVTVTIGKTKYTATADNTGAFSVTIPVQKAGVKVSVIATDTAGNSSTAKTVTVVDKTAPAAPTVNEVGDNATAVTGKTEAGATVTVTIGTTTYTATADSTGAFSVTIPAQKAGVKVSVTAKDKAGNLSAAKTVTVVDKSAPTAPTVNEVGDKATVVTGTTEAGATVTVTIGTTAYTAQADSTGAFSVTIPVQKDGVNISVTATDAAGNTSEAASVTVKDKTAPAAPSVNTIADNAKVVTGKTEAGSTVTVTIGTTKYTATADSAGAFSVTIPAQKAGVKISVTATDKAGNVSAAKTVTVVDKTAPAAPTVNTVGDNAKTVTGKTEAGATVTVTIGTTKYTATADSAGAFSVTIPVQKAGVKISVTATDKAGNVSAAKTVTVVDKTAPAAPTVNTVGDNAKAVTGKTEAGAKVTVTIGTTKYTATADSTGAFSVTIPTQKAGVKISVTATDKAGNVSAAKTVTVVDKTAPATPKVNAVTSTATVVTGTAEAYSTITIKVGTVVIGTGTTDKYGKFKVTIKAAQKKNTVLTVTATDAAKNTSTATTVKVQ